MISQIGQRINRQQSAVARISRFVVATCATLLVITANSICTLADQAVHRSLIALWETGPNLGSGEPWPAGLRLMVDSDGGVLYSRIGDRRQNQALYLSGSIAAPEASKLSSKYLDLLRNAERRQDRSTGFADLGSTNLQIWDPDTRTYRVWWVRGHPCSDGRGTPEALDTMLRSEVEPDFLAACDELLKFAVQGARVWRPLLARVELDRSEQLKGTALAWPADWRLSQPMQNDATICVALDEGSSEVTRSIFQSGVSAGSLRDLQLRSASGDLWQVISVRFLLPTEIANEESDVRRFSAGPCLP